MGKKKDALLRKLQRAQASRTAIRLTRRIPGADKIDGYVVGIGRKWLLLADVPAVRIDGYVAVRLSDVSRVKVRSTGAFYEQVARARGTWPPVAPGTIDLDTTRRLIATAHDHAVLVALHPEREATDVCYIGVPTKWRSRGLRLTEVTPSAVWNGWVSKWRFAEITRVGFSGDYEADLLLIAGPPPGRSAG